MGREMKKQRNRGACRTFSVRRAVAWLRFRMSVTSSAVGGIRHRSARREAKRGHPFVNCP